MKRLHIPVAFAALLAAGAWAQNPAKPTLETPDTGTPIFRVNVVSRTINVVNFHHRQGSTELALERTALSPRAKGEVRVESRTGATKIDLRAENLNPPQSVGAEYLTYVAWAITPEGRPQNLGEVTLDGDDDARLQAATELQSFGMIVTAEPYFAVSQPSDAIVLEATVKRGSTKGTISPLEAKYELWPRGMYASQLPAAQRVWSRKTGKEAPIALEQARHALVIARANGADKYAADTLKKADTDLFNADAFLNNRGDVKKIETLARNATQLAEDARLIAVKRGEEERLETERKSAEARLAAAQTAAEQESRRRELAEAERRLAEERAENAKLRAEQQERERIRLEAEKSTAEAARQTAQEQAEAARFRAEREAEQRVRLDALRQQAETAAQEAKQAAALAEQQRVAAEAARQAAIVEQDRLKEERAKLAAEAETARAAATKAEQNSARLREDLRNQLNAVLATRESARGLIVNMSDVLFDSGQFSLRQGAREKLARIAGIVLAHPGLRIQVEGHTDSVGADSWNQTLSERRAEAVAHYLMSQGIRSDSISSAGFGETQPVADNTSASGRQQNRRVELVVSGEAIQQTFSPRGG